MCVRLKLWRDLNCKTEGDALEEAASSLEIVGRTEGTKENPQEERRRREQQRREQKRVRTEGALSEVAYWRWNVVPAIRLSRVFFWRSPPCFLPEKSSGRESQRPLEANI